MSLPRCGFSDKKGLDIDNRMAGYQLQGSRWNRKNLTYKTSSYPQRLREADVDVEIAKAFLVWSEPTGLTFTRNYSGLVHIEIMYVLFSISMTLSHFQKFLELFV